MLIYIAKVSADIKINVLSKALCSHWKVFTVIVVLFVCLALVACPPPMYEGAGFESSAGLCFRLQNQCLPFPQMQLMNEWSNEEKPSTWNFLSGSRCSMLLQCCHHSSAVQSHRSCREVKENVVMTNQLLLNSHRKQTGRNQLCTGTTQQQNKHKLKQWHSCLVK